LNDGTRILLVDDDPAIRRLLKTSLPPHGFVLDLAEDAALALKAIAAKRPELVILDLGLPDMDGIEIIRRLRAGRDHLPILVLSSRNDEHGKVTALEAGADDYVTKPFGMAELIARIRTSLRHRFHEQGAEPVFRARDVEVDLLRRHVRVRGSDVKLSPKEFDIMRLLVVHAGKVLTHRMIMHEIWGAEGDVQYLRIYIRQLRQKLERDPERPELILTETGVGYRLAEA
jgi:two-component system KDP operon response regulator KdpE